MRQGFDVDCPAQRPGVIYRERRGPVLTRRAASWTSLDPADRHDGRLRKRLSVASPNRASRRLSAPPARLRERPVDSIPASYLRTQRRGGDLRVRPLGCRVTFGLGTRRVEGTLNPGDSYHFTPTREAAPAVGQRDRFISRCNGITRAPRPRRQHRPRRWSFRATPSSPFRHGMPSPTPDCPWQGRSWARTGLSSAVCFAPLVVERGRRGLIFAATSTAKAPRKGRSCPTTPIRPPGATSTAGEPPDLRRPVAVGGDAPISVQSMTNTLTTDVAATIAQIQRCADAGADIIRVSVPDKASSRALREIVPEKPDPDRRRHPFSTTSAASRPPRGRRLPAHQPRQHRRRDAREGGVIAAARDHNCSSASG